MKTLYYLNVDFYRYYIGRDGQSVSETNMINRIDQQLYVNKRMFDDFDFSAIKPDHLRKYMLSYLETITVVSTSIAYISNDPENIAKVKKLWRYIKLKDPKTYRHIRWGALGRKISVKAYKLSQKFMGFN